MKPNKDIKTTSDYTLFSFHESQQPISTRHSAGIAESMREIGFLRSKPITVVRENGKLKIIDGHHRFFAAKALGLAIFYVIEDATISNRIGQLNSTVRKWDSLSFAKMYADQGNPHYIELLEYVERGIPLRKAAAMLGGEMASSGNVCRLIPHGTFQVVDRKRIAVIAKVIDALAPINEVAKTQCFIDALSALAFLPDFDCGTLVDRIDASPRSLIKCVSRDQMLELLEEIYNFRSRIKVPIAHQAKESARMRSATVMAGKKASK